MPNNITLFLEKYKLLFKWLITLLLVVAILLMIIFQYFFISNVNTYYNELKQEKINYKTHINQRVLNNSLFLKGLNKNFNLITFQLLEKNIEFITNEILFIEKNTIYESVYFIDRSKGILITDNHFTSTDQIYRHFRNIDWYEDSIKYQRAEISGVMKDLDNVYRIVAMSIPVIHENETIGFIVGKIRVNSLEANQMFNYNYNSNYIYYLEDSMNNTIYNYHEKYNTTELNIFDRSLISIFSKYTLDNFQHIYDGSTFTYWKYKINLNLEKIKLETINEIYNLLIVFILFFILLMVVLSTLFIKYKKEILLDVALNRKRQLSKLKKRVNNDYLYLFFVNIENLSILNELYDYKFANNILVKFTTDFNQLIKENHDHRNNLIYLGGNDFVLIMQLESWSVARECLDKLLERYSIKTFDYQNHKVRLKINYILYKFNLKKYEIDVLEEQMNKISKLMRIVFKKESMNFLVYEDYEMIQRVYAKHEKVKEFLLEVIDNKAIEPFFQPIIDLRTGKIVQYEVLLRIVDDDIYLSPYPYIKVSEKYGLINTIDYLIIEKTLEYLTSLNWEPKISFNISSIELANKKHLKNIIKLIKNEYAYDLRKITFEITETKIIEDFDLILENIRFLKNNGLKISLDDFGTGFSNLITLKKLKTMCDYIKIDGIFIQNLNETEDEEYIVKSIVNLAKAYKMLIVAEFVESDVIKEILKDLEVDYGQGYLFSKPNQIIKFYNKDIFN